MDIPVYLFTGFLDAGKTKFIQETLSDERFNKGESTLLLLCEEGEESYNPSEFSGPNVFIEPITEKKKLTAQTMDTLIRKHGCERVVIEYNGMWLLDDLYKALPESWMVYQEFMFADAGSFASYYNNMRGLVVDKMKSCEMLVLNRASTQIDKQMIHEAVRAVNRRADIAYEDAQGTVTYDEIEDPLPFDLNATIIEIAEAHFATWYRDLSEEPEKYKGKIVKVCGFALLQDDLPSTTFIFGRRIMTCCVEDIGFAGILCLWKETEKILHHKDWIELQAKVTVQTTKEGPTPVLHVISAVKKQEPESDLATFF